MSETGPMTLTEFLLARIAEDERRNGWRWDGILDDEFYSHAADGALTRMDRECEAKRRIVEECRSASGQGPGAEGLADVVLQSLTLPYVDHPDCRKEWTPVT